MNPANANTNVIAIAPAKRPAKRAEKVEKHVEFPNVFHYNDAIDFVSASLQAFKKRNPSFSQRGLARILKISSPGLFNLILNRKRPLNEQVGKEIERVFLSREILKPGEEAYFQSLVRLGLAQTEDDRKRIFEELLQLRYDREHYLLSVNDLNAFRRWETIALQVSAHLKDFQYNPQYLFQLFHESVPAHELVFMVEHMVRQGLLEHVGSTIRRPQLNVSSKSDIPSEQVRSIHRQFMLEALKRLDTTKVEDRDYSSYTMCIDKSKMTEAKALIKDFRRKLARLMETESAGDAVYQLNVQFFPLLADPKDESVK